MAQTTLYCGNIPAGCTDVVLHALFSHMGPVSSVRLPTPKGAVHFAFVEMVRPESCAAAQQLNGFELGGRSLVVSLADPGGRRNADAGAAKPAGGGGGADGGHGAPAAAAQHAPAALPYAYPPPAGAAPPPPPSSAAPGARGGGEEGSLRVACTLHLTGVDPSVDDLQLASHFARAGQVVATRLGGVTTGARAAWVQLTTPREAVAAVGLHLGRLGREPVKVAASRTPILQNGLSRWPAAQAAAACAARPHGPDPELDCCLVLSLLPGGADDEEIRTWASERLPGGALQWARRLGTHALLRCASPAAARDAFARLQGQALRGAAVGVEAARGPPPAWWTPPQHAPPAAPPTQQQQQQQQQQQLAAAAAEGGAEGRAGGGKAMPEAAAAAAPPAEGAGGGGEGGGDAGAGATWRRRGDDEDGPEEGEAPDGL